MKYPIPRCPNCKPSRRCLRHSIIPYAATMWVEINSPDFYRLRHRIIKSNGRSIKNDWAYLVSLEGLTFEEVPLSYLDWLSGQSWVYGELRKRLTLYLTHHSIQKELDDLFPDPDDDSRQPIFLVTNTFTNKEPMPKEDPTPLNWAPPTTYQLRWQAWSQAADLLCLFDSDDPNTLLEVDPNYIKTNIIPHLPEPTQNKLREAYRTFRHRLQSTRAEPQPNLYRLHSLGAL